MVRIRDSKTGKIIKLEQDIAKVAVSVFSEQLKKVDELAKEQDLSRSDVFRQALDLYIEARLDETKESSQPVQNEPINPRNSNNESLPKEVETKALKRGRKEVNVSEKKDLEVDSSPTLTPLEVLLKEIKMGTA